MLSLSQGFPISFPLLLARLDFHILGARVKHFSTLDFVLASPSQCETFLSRLMRVQIDKNYGPVSE